jgi:hypothetical protein
MDTDPEPFFCILLFEDTFKSIFKGKKSKRSHKTVEIKGFSYYFCLMIEGSRSGSGSIPLSNGSGSGSRRLKTRGSGGSGFGSATLLQNKGQGCGQCWGSRSDFFSILDPNFFPSRIPSIKELKYFNPRKNSFKALGSMIRVVHPGLRIRISNTGYGQCWESGSGCFWGLPKPDPDP